MVADDNDDATRELRRLGGKAGQIASANVEATLNSLDPLVLEALDPFVVELAIARGDHELVERLATALGVHVSEARARLASWIETLESAGSNR